MKPASIGIIGGGMLGLVLALRLRQAGHQVTVLESAKEIGGLAGAWQLGPISWDRHYHVILLSDTQTRGLCEEIGLANELRWKTTRTGFFTAGKLHSLSSGWDFLKFSPLSLWQKFRLGLTILAASRAKNAKPFEQIPVEDWLRRWSGRQTTETIWIPLLKSKLGDAYQEASAAFIWATIARMYAARRTGLKREMFGYVAGGYAKILTHLSAKLQDLGVQILTDTPVTKVASPEGRPIVTTKNDRTFDFDSCVITAATPIASKLCPDFSPEEHDRLNAIQYRGIICASLLLRRPLADFYVTNITDADLPFTGVIEMSTLVDPAELGGHYLVYLPKYLPPNDPMFNLSDEEIKRRFLAGLRTMYPHFCDQDLLAFEISRVKYVFAVSTLHYSDLAPKPETSLENVWLANSAQILHGTLNVNETIALANRAAAIIRVGQNNSSPIPVEHY